MCCLPSSLSSFVSRTLFSAASKIHVFGKYNLNKNGIRRAQKISLLNYLYISPNLFTCFTSLVYGQLLHVNFISERRGEIFRRFRLRRINRPWNSTIRLLYASESVTYILNVFDAKYFLVLKYIQRFHISTLRLKPGVRWREIKTGVSSD